MIQFLLWKQSLDPERFAAFHPKLSPALTRLAAPTVSPQELSPSPQNDSSGGSSPLEPQQIPEPSALLLAACLVGWGIYWRRRAAASQRNVPRRVAD
jgi:hypothetical protein